MADEDAAGLLAGGEGGDGGQGGGQRGGAGEVEAGEREAGGGGVRVGVDEGRGDQGAVEFDDLVGGPRVGLGGAVAADPGDVLALDEHGRGEGVGGAVDGTAAQQDGP